MQFSPAERDGAEGEVLPGGAVPAERLHLLHLLAHMDHTRLKEMATAADQLVAMRAAPAAVAAVEADPGEVVAVAARGGGTGAGRKPAVAAKQKKKKLLEEPEPSKAVRQAAGLCLRHWRYGAQAFGCDGDCCWWAGGN